MIKPHWLKKIRENRGMTTTALANLAHTARSTINKIERGNGYSYKLSTIIKIGVVLGLNPDEIRDLERREIARQRSRKCNGSA